MSSNDISPLVSIRITYDDRENDIQMQNIPLSRVEEIQRFRIFRTDDPCRLGRMCFQKRVVYNCEIFRAIVLCVVEPLYYSGKPYSIKFFG